MSRPSITTPPRRAIACCKATMRVRTRGRADRGDVRLLISGVRISAVISRPSTKTRPGSSRTSSRSASAPTASHPRASVPVSSTAQARARYIAPVST